MYSKLPQHTPMIDRGLPVKYAGKLGLLMDDPNRINGWIKLEDGQKRYTCIRELHAINLCGLQIAIKPTEGLIYTQGQFGIL